MNCVNREKYTAFSKFFNIPATIINQHEFTAKTIKKINENVYEVARNNKQQIYDDLMIGKRPIEPNDCIEDEIIIFCKYCGGKKV